MSWIPAKALRMTRVVRNSAIDIRYGKLLIGKQQSAYTHLGSRHVENSDYGALDLVFDGRLRPEDVLVDVGCGKGRVINWWLRHGYGERGIYGLELDPDVAARTRARLGAHDHVTVLDGDAVELLPFHADVLYLYNPFDETVMPRFIDKVKALYSDEGVRVLYYNCKHVELFADDPRFDVEVVPVGPPGPASYDDLAVIELEPRPRDEDVSR